MPLTLEDVDWIIGGGVFVEEPAHQDTTFSAPSGPGSCRSSFLPPVGRQLSAPRKRANDETHAARATHTKKPRLTTEEKVQKFLNGGTWNALIPEGASALEPEYACRVASAAAAMGLPDRLPDRPSNDPDVDADADANDATAPVMKPVYKSIDNLLCLAVATPIHCGLASSTHVAPTHFHASAAAPAAAAALARGPTEDAPAVTQAPQDAATIAPSAELPSTSKAALCRTPEVATATRAGTAETTGMTATKTGSSDRPTRPLPNLRTPSRPTSSDASEAESAAHTAPQTNPPLSPALEMGMPKMWRSHSGTQLSCY